jgi:hypothetical protein
MVERNVNEENEVKEYLVPKTVVAPLMGNFNMVHNKLGEVFTLPQGDAAQAMQWWQKQNPEDQLTLRFILTGLASPAMINNISILRGDTRLKETTLVQPSLLPEDPCFLLGEDAARSNYAIRRLPSTDTMAATLLMYLNAGLEPGVAEFKFEVNLNEFVVLLATLDLQKRSIMQAKMEHEDISLDLKLADVQKSLADGLQYPDPRWLLPYVLPVISAKPNLDWNGIWQAALGLSQQGLLKISQDKTTVSLNDAGMLLATEMDRRMSTLRIASFGYDAQGRSGSSTALLIRGESLVWFMDVGDSSVVVAAIDLDKAGELLKEIFRPSAAPQVSQPAKVATPKVTPKAAAQKPVTPQPTPQQAAPKAAPQQPTPPRGAPSKVAAPAGQQARYCQDCGQPASWIEQYKRWYCYKCKKYLP